MDSVLEIFDAIRKVPNEAFVKVNEVSEQVMPNQHRLP